MKKTLFVLAVLLLIVSSGLWAQPVPTIGQYQDAFADFAAGVAQTLPATAAVAGLSWSPAYIGQFPPHFGVGVSVGAFTIPYAALEPAVGLFGTSLPSELAFVEKWGLPFPAVALDARLGGFVLPFDLGFKIGFIPEALREHMGNINADYFLVGGDVRFLLLKEKNKPFVPALSVSAGYTFWRANIGVPDVMGTGDYDVDLSPLTPHTLTFTAPELTFDVQTHTLVAKVQASKNLLIFTPNLGLGAAYGISTAGGGLASNVLYDNHTITPAEIEQIKSLFESAYGTTPDLSSGGFLVNAEANGWSFWVFGGTAINIFWIKVDLSAMYNFLSGSYGGAVNVRLQL